MSIWPETDLANSSESSSRCSRATWRSFTIANMSGVPGAAVVPPLPVPSDVGAAMLRGRRHYRRDNVAVAAGGT